MITDLPRIATWTWKQKVNLNLRQQTDDNDTRQWTNDKFRLDYQLPDNNKNLLDQKHILTDFDSGHNTRDNSKIHERNEEQFSDKRHDNRHKDEIYFEEEWNQQLLQLKKQQDKIHLELDRPHDNKRDQRQTTNKKPAHLRLKSKLTKVVALFGILSLLPGATSRCITLADNIINEKGQTAKVKFSTVDCSIQKISIPLSNQETNAGLLPLKFKVYEFGTKPGEEPTTNTLDKTTTKPIKETEVLPDKVPAAQPDTEVTNKPGGELINKAEEAASLGEEAAIAPQMTKTLLTKTTTDRSLDDDDGKLLPQLDPNEEGTALNKPDTDDIIKPEPEPEEVVTPKLDPIEEGKEPIDKPDTEDINKPGAEPINKPEEESTPKLDLNEDPNEELNVPETNLDTEEIEAVGNKPISENDVSLALGAENDLIYTIVEESISKVTKQTTKNLSKHESFLESNVSLVIGADEEVLDNIQGNILPVTQKTVKTDVENKDETKAPVTKTNIENINVIDFIPEETAIDPPKQFDGEENGNAGKETTKNRKATETTSVITQMNGDKTTTPKNGNDEKRTAKKTIETDLTISAIIAKSTEKLGVTTFSLMPTGEKQIKENTQLKGDKGIVTTDYVKRETKRQTIEPSVRGKTTTSTREQVTDEKSTKDQSVEKISMMTHHEKQITESGSLKEETHPSLNNPENKETITSRVTNIKIETKQIMVLTEIQIKDTLETINDNLHQTTKMDTSKEDTYTLSDKTKSNGKATTISINGQETITNKSLSENASKYNELPAESEKPTSSMTSSTQNTHLLKGNSSGTSMEQNIEYILSTSSKNLSKRNISTSSKSGKQTAEYEHSEGEKITTSSVTQTSEMNVTLSNNIRETAQSKTSKKDQTNENLAMNGEHPTIEIKASTTAMINKNDSEINIITIYDKRTKSKPVGLDTTVMPTNQRVSTTTKENGGNDHEDKLTTSNYQKIITKTGTSRGNIKSSEDQSKVMVTTMKTKNNEQTTTLSEISSNEKTSPLPKNETKMVDNIFEYSKEYDKLTTIKYGEEVLGKETKSSETSNVDKNNNELTSKITNSMSEHIGTSKTTKPIENIKMTDAEIKLTTPVNKNKMTQKEQSSSNKGTIEDPIKGNTEKAITSNTENNGHISKISQTRDSRLTSSAENIVTSKPISGHSSTFHLEITPSENEFESIVEINGSTREKELSQTTEFTEENLSKLSQPSTIEGPNPNNPENTKGNSDTGGATTNIAKAPEIDNDIKLTKFELHFTKDVNPGKTRDSRLTSSTDNIVTSKPISEHSSTFHLEKTPSENEFESTVKINGFMPKKTSLRQGSTREKELSQTTEFTKENLSKLTQPTTIEGPNPNNPENTKGNSDTGGATTNIAKAPEIDNDIKLTKFELHSTKDVNNGKTRDSRLTSSAENIVTSNPISEYSSTFHFEIKPSENEFESTVEINGFMPKKTSLRQGSKKEKELSQTAEFTKENLSKLTQPSTIEGPNPNNPENTKGNSDTGGETTNIAKAPEIDNAIKLTKFELHSTQDVNTGKSLVQTDNTDKLTVTTKDSVTRHDDKQVETTDKTEDKMKTTKETNSKETSPNQPPDILELIVSPEKSKGQITQLNSNSYLTSALGKVIQTKNTEYSTTQPAETLAQAADGNTDYDKNTQISTSITYGTKTKTSKAGETTTKDHPSEQKGDTIGLMNTNKVSLESITPNKQASSTKLIKIVSENEQTEKSKHSTTERNRETLDIGNDAKTFGIDLDPTSTSTSTLTTPCACPTTSSLSSSTQSTTPGILTTSGSCFCPDITSSMAEEETSTNMPEMKGRRRRRKEIEEMDLYVDNFDQKIMKKMPFLKFY